jgi:hypothetical protein
MKVENENEFRPITITLETQDEAMLIGCLLDCCAEDSMNKYVAEKEYCKAFRNVDIEELSTEMWVKFNQAYNITRYRPC